MGVHGKSADRMAGMVSFRDSTSKSGGGGRHGQYITFRVMVENSPGWKVPAQPGKFPAKTVADLIRPVAEEMFREAVERDIAAALDGTTT
jgi:hypothetical protein